MMVNKNSNQEKATIKANKLQKGSKNQFTIKLQIYNQFAK